MAVAKDNLENYWSYKGCYTHDVHERCLIFKTTHPSCPSTSKIFHLLDLRAPVSNEPPSPNDNQSIKKTKSKDNYYMLSGSFFSLTFVFSINSLILPSFNWSLTICSFVALYSVWVVIRKYHKIFFIYNYSHFKY